MSKTYYIFRHGQTFATKYRNGWYWQTIFSAPILEEARPSIIKLAEYLKNVQTDYNVASPFLRCRQTAEIVRNITGKEFVTDRRLREYVMEWPWNFKRRIVRFIRDIENSEHEVILICTHSIIIEMLIQYLLRDKLHLFQRIFSPRPGVLTIVKDKKSTIVNFNDPEISVTKEK